jgi:hypothetical protein
VKNIFRVFILASFFLIPSPLLRADTLNVDTEYRLRGVYFANLDYDKTTSTDALHFYDQRLCISIGGKFAPNVEIGSKITALGIVGTTTNYFNAPFPRTDFTPYIENAFVKIINMADTNLDLTVGKIGLVFGDGLIIDDNGAGFNALKLDGNYKLPVPFSNKVIPFKGELFLAKISESINQDTDSDLFGGVATLDFKKNLVEIGYFDQRDYSGTPFALGSLSTPTKSIQKQFYDIRIGKKEKLAAYQFEIVKENGIITKPNLTSVNIDGLGWVASGKLIGEKTKLGKVEARAGLAVFSGNDNTASLDHTDNSFSPTFTKRWDGLERSGYGELVAATPMDAFIKFPDPYSGFSTLSVGAGFTPLYAWTFGVDYYLFSATQGPKGATTASGFERIFGAEFSLGIELDLSAKLELSKYVSMRVSYARYTPPTDVYWPKMDPLDRYAWEVTSKF